MVDGNNTEVSQSLESEHKKANHEPIFILSSGANSGSYREYNGPQTTVLFYLEERNLNSPRSVSSDFFRRKTIIRPQSCFFTRPSYEGSDQYVNPSESATMISEAIDRVCKQRPSLDYAYTMVDENDRPLVEAYHALGFRPARIILPEEAVAIRQIDPRFPKPPDHRNHSLWSLLIPKD